MGVSWVMEYPATDQHKSASTVVSELCQYFERIGGIKSGNYSVDMEAFAPLDTFVAMQKASANADFKQCAINVCHSSEFPSTSLCLLTGSDVELPRVTADRMFDQIIHKLQASFAPRQNSKMELHGQKFKLGDFVLKTGVVTCAGVSKGIIVEVEYEPCINPYICQELLKEFVSDLLGSAFMNTATIPPPHFQRLQAQAQAQGKDSKAATAAALNSLVCDADDNMSQYHEVFMHLRKATAQPTARPAMMATST